MNESGLETLEEQEYLYSILKAAWHCWIPDERKHACYRFGVDYRDVCKYISGNECEDEHMENFV